MGTYRPDIDGLRAVSILAVVLYHARLPGFEAGYLGVDVFFVISGFLITGQLLRQAESTGTLSLVSFYARRVRRLAPAFVAMAVGTSILAALYLLPLFEQGDFGGALSRSAVLYYNIAAWRGSYDYAAPDSQEQVLMHTWSLAVEEQFYLAWPWICLAAVRLGRPLLAFSLIVLVSFLGAWWMLPRDPAAVFFLLPFRVWELGLGACVAARSWPVPTRIAGALTAIGAGLVGYALLSGVGPASSLWLCGTAAAGAALVTAFGHVANPVSTVLRSPPMVHLGRLSYSWYLWHWPLLVIARLVAVFDDPISVTAALATSLVLAELTYFGLELPARRIQIHRPRRVLALGAGALAVLFVLGQVFEWRSRRLKAQPENAALLSRLKIGPIRPCEGDVAALGCQIGAPDAQGRSILLWGDSFARAFSPALAAYSTASGQGARLVTVSSCPPLLGVAPNDSRRPSNMTSACPQSLHLMRPELDRRKSDISGVVLAASWSVYGAADPRGERSTRFFDDSGQGMSGAVALRRGLRSTLDALESIGARVLILGAPPAFPYDPRKCLSRVPGRCFVERAWREKDRDSARAAIQEAIRGRSEVRFVEVFDLLCPNDPCQAGTLEEPILGDRSHLSVFAARRIVLPAVASHLDWLRGATDADSPRRPE